MNFVTLCLARDNTGEGRCRDVIARLELKATPPRWVNGTVTVEASPELKEVLKGRTSTNFLLDRNGKILRSNIAPKLVAEVLAETTR